MTRYDLIGFDMDGTILNSEKTISEATVEAVNRAVAAGKQVILSTGRCISELKEYEEMLVNVRYYVCESGALIYDTNEKKVIHTENLDADSVHQVFDLIDSEDVMVYLMSKGVAYASPAHIARADHYHMGIYREMMERVVDKVDSVVDFYRSNDIYVEKMNLYSASPEIREKIFEQIKDFPLEKAYAEETSLELSPLGISKASGLIWLCEHLQIPLERTIIVGDADNDIEALKAAGLSVAMGNAKPHIKELCDVVVADNDHDGCAEAVYEYLLSE